jgi:C4-dicarboxylate transporter
MAVTDRIFISTQQDIQLLDFILKQKSSEAIIALITCVLLHLILQ